MTRSALLAGAVAAAVGAVACGGVTQPGVPDAGASSPAPHLGEDSGAREPVTPGTEDAGAFADAAPFAPPETPDASIPDTGRPCDEDVMAPAADYGIPPSWPCRDGS